MFNNNEGRFYQQLNKDVHNEKNVILMPMKREAIGKVYGVRVKSIIEE